MDYTMTDEHIEITCTLAECEHMELRDYNIYATPEQDSDGISDRIAAVYFANQPKWMYDFLLATSQDFANAVGLDMFDFANAENDYSEDMKDEITLTVPRTRQDREA